MNGNYPIYKGKFGEEQERSYTVHELSLLLFFAPWCFSFAPKGAILPTLRNTAPDTTTSSDTDNDRDASATCLSDSFLAVCSYSQSDKDLSNVDKVQRSSFSPRPHKLLMQMLLCMKNLWNF